MTERVVPFVVLHHQCQQWVGVKTHSLQSKSASHTSCGELLCSFSVSLMSLVSNQSKPPQMSHEMKLMKQARKLLRHVDVKSMAHFCTVTEGTFVSILAGSSSGHFHLLNMQCLMFIINNNIWIKCSIKHYSKKKINELIPKMSKDFLLFPKHTD